MLTASPTVTVAGSPVALAHTGPGLTAIDELSVSWGRSGLFDAPTPATLSCRLLEHTLDGWGSLAARTDLIGQDVQVSWVGSDAATVTTMFRGRITDVEVSPADLPSIPGGGWFVHLAASSRETEAANYSVAPGTAWPAETFAARLARIKALFPARMFPGGIAMPTINDLPYPGRDQSILTALDAMTCAPVTSASGNGLDLLRAHAASVTPLPLVYDPATDGFTFAHRRAYENTAGNFTVAGFSPVPAVGPTSWAAVSNGDNSQYYTVGGPLTASLMPGGRRSLDMPLDARVTNVEVTYFDSTAAYAQKTVTAATADASLESTIGRRTLSVASVHATTANAAQLAKMYADLAGAENRQRRLSGVSFDTQSSGGFSSRTQMLTLLSAKETGESFFITGSWLPRLGKRPMTGLMGGRIAYRDGDWFVDGVSAPVHVYSPTVPLKVYNVSSPSVNLRLADLDSTTFGDAAYLELGAGYTFLTQPGING